MGIRRILDAYSREGLAISSVRKGEGDPGGSAGDGISAALRELAAFGRHVYGAGRGIPAIRSEEELAIELLTAKGVYLLPGRFYDFPSGGFLVVSLITPSTDFAQGVANALTVF